MAQSCICPCFCFVFSGSKISVFLYRYKLLEEFFGGLVSSIRLLQLKGSSTTFTNISAKVECLTDRYANDEHLCMHLQMISL